MPEKGPHGESKNRPHGELSRRSKEIERGEDSVPVARVAVDVVAPSRTPTSREGAAQPPAAIIEVMPVPSSPKAGTAARLEGANVPPMVPSVTIETRVLDPVLTRPSTFSMPPLGVLRDTAMILPNASMILDAGLVNRLLGFIF